MSQLSPQMLTQTEQLTDAAPLPWALGCTLHHPPIYRGCPGTCAAWGSQIQESHHQGAVIT